jgi:S-adenosylmethionine:tRNA ribosyltransferase-isomerase
MDVGLFDFDLPEELIALRPVSPRDSARLLHVQPGTPARFDDHFVRDLPGLLRPGDLLVLNDTRVIPARLFATRQRGEASARIELMLHQRLDDGAWLAFARPAKKISVGETLTCGELSATVRAKGERGEVTLVFDKTGGAFDAALQASAELPLPPYIARKRAVDAADAEDYQTVYAREAGAVAAPTAGLHLTPDLLYALNLRGVGTVQVTLHVGAGTFLPVTVDDTDAHRMHSEWGEVTDAAARQMRETKASGGRIVCVGTTSLRLVETAAANGQIEAFRGPTSIFITPGYRFRAVDALMTNFHLPRSTLFMLVSAFCGLATMKAAYATAISRGYRFYSYGDTSLLERAGT